MNPRNEDPGHAHVGGQRQVLRQRRGLDLRQRSDPLEVLALEGIGRLFVVANHVEVHLDQRRVVGVET